MRSTKRMRTDPPGAETGEDKLIIVAVGARVRLGPSFLANSVRSCAEVTLTCEAIGSGATRGILFDSGKGNVNTVYEHELAQDYENIDVVVRECGLGERDVPLGGDDVESGVLRVPYLLAPVVPLSQHAFLLLSDVFPLLWPSPQRALPRLLLRISEGWHWGSLRTNPHQYSEGWA